MNAILRMDLCLTSNEKSKGNHGDPPDPTPPQGNEALSKL